MVLNRNVELLSSFLKKLGLGSAQHFALEMQKARPKLELGIGSDTALNVRNKTNNNKIRLEGKMVEIS